MLMSLTSLARIAALSAGFLLSVLAAAQNVNVSPSSVPHVALKGHDPVAYFTEQRPVKGNSERTFDFDGSRYLFASDKNRAAFVANPDRYAPQFEGLCTAGLSVGYKVEADPNQWTIIDGKLYVFSSAGALAKAKNDPNIIKTAHAKWSRLK